MENDSFFMKPDFKICFQQAMLMNEFGAEQQMKHTDDMNDSTDSRIVPKKKKKKREKAGVCLCAILNNFRSEFNEQ